MQDNEASTPFDLPCPIFPRQLSAVIGPRLRQRGPPQPPHAEQYSRPAKGTMRMPCKGNMHQYAWNVSCFASASLILELP